MLDNDKLVTAFADPDGIGDKNNTGDGTLPAPLPILDSIPGDTTTTAELTVDGSRIVSTINAPGDQDWFRVELQGGVTYEFGEYMTRSGPSGVPLADAYLQVFDAAGNWLASEDGGGPYTPSGLDALMTFTPETTGTYYISAGAFDEDGDGTSEPVGDYEVFARHTSYVPYYDPNSPLHSIDWGTQFDGTSRNPDGAEGPRPTGNELENKIGGKNVIYVYFAREGDVFVSESLDPTHLTATMIAKGMQQWEKDAFNAVFDEYEKVADIVYVETDNRYAADINVVTYNGTPGPGISLLGRMSPPDEYNEGQTEYNAGDERWTQEGVAPGGFYFGTLIHEFGHGHGLAHPHDDGGHSSVMHGVDSAGIDTPGGNVPDPVGIWPNYTLGDFNLNQGVYTMMSYMDGWQLSPYGQADDDAGYGYIGSLMALDIAAIQDKYGVNEEWATGDDTYTLKDVNAPGTFYSSIWDAGGTDQIVYNGSRDAHIDLRPATLKYEDGGGGWISYAWGIYGGFTIANGVTIENARTGSGNDVLIGNAANNVLNGGLGNDKIDGGGGSDTASYDGIVGSVRIDLSLTGAQNTKSGGTDTLIAIENAIGGGGNDVIKGTAGGNVLGGAAGDDYLYGLAGDDLLVGGLGNDRVEGGAGTDTAGYARASGVVTVSLAVTVAQNTGAAGTDTLTGIENLAGGADRDIFTGNAGANVLWGNEGNDRLTGGAGRDTLVGGLGADKLWGGTEADVFRFERTEDSSGASIDRIYDFRPGDVIDLGAIDAVSGTSANEAFTFIDGNAFSGAAGELRLASGDGSIFIEGDVNGDKIADIRIEVVGTLAPVATDFVL